MNSIRLIQYKLASLVLIIMVGSWNKANAQNTWQYVGDYKDILGLYDSQHFVVDDGNRDYKYTTDGGVTLQNFGMSISSPKSLYFVEYLSTTQMRAVVFTGSNFELHESTDGGVTFTLLSNILPSGMAPLNQPPQLVSFDNSESLLYCKVLYNSQLLPVLFRTTDGGASWSLATADTFDLADLYDIQIYKNGHVIAASNTPTGIEISTDRGQSFTQTPGTPPLNSGMSVAFDGNQTLWVSRIAGSQNDDSYISTDAGSTWNTWTAMNDDVDMKLTGTSTLMVYGSSDTTAISTDGGSSFNTVSFPATKPAGSLLRLQVGGDQQTYYINDGNAKLWTFGGSGIGIEEVVSTSGVQIFPNPAMHELTISDYSGTARIYNMAGQLILSTDIQDNITLDLTEIPKGVLVLELDHQSFLFVKE